MISDIKIFYYKFDKENNWRFHIISLSHVVPVVWIVFELLLNKVRIPWHHVIYTMILTAVYFLSSYVS